MSVEPDMKKVLAPMVEREVTLTDPAFQVDRARVLARMAQTRPPERHVGRGLFALAACVAMLFVGARLWPRGGASLEVLVSEGSAATVRGGAPAAVARGQSTRIAADGELETGAGSKARVRMADGLEIELGGQTRVALDELRAGAPSVRLIGGAIRCHVPHRADGRAFHVVTADVTVVDLGTVFTVAVDGAHATHVSVEEGEVLVRYASGETHVAAPSSWPSVPAAVEPAVIPSAPATTTPSAKRGHASLRTTHAEPTPAATLAEEAELLRHGLAAERQGRFSEASATLKELLTRFPRSPLAADASAALARVTAGAPP